MKLVKSTYLPLLMVLALASCSKDQDLNPGGGDTVAAAKEESLEAARKTVFLDSIQELRNQNARKLAAMENTSRGFYSIDAKGDYVTETKQLVISAGNDFRNDLSAQIKENYANLLEDLIRKGKGANLIGTDHEDNYSDNSLAKINVPEKEYWTTRKDQTFHAYTVITNLGEVGNGVDLNYVKNLLLNKYSYPGYRLRPVPNCVGNGTALVYGTLPDPIHLSDPNTYTVPSGIIGQELVPDGILNITDTNHVFYKGTIRKVAFQYNNHIFIATYGIGINRSLNLPDNFVNAPLFSTMAKQNDQYGTLIFIVMDRQVFSEVEQKRLQ